MKWDLVLLERYQIATVKTELFGLVVMLRLRYPGLGHETENHQTVTGLKRQNGHH